MLTTGSHPAIFQSHSTPT